ncbi:response regulator [Limnoraphis robusta Tam1]|jgi:CheY-like chemotaxis protein|uniref:Response regulator n=1 Tax=Limnoraphis robusta CCNP1315 TaxID=3110306 RepID=A0ABU5U2B7_9CYAN|nr:response regulator [Limnoraphis robusta]MEA5500054.1 response regulator [Limnoraphis robusta BA-68 BA1]MEA5521200.1 response regulator [Limnoraphis robusta CCNP1315]MEA5537919.1 response regulator [Limnoraphis robusta Tam1]MEA5546650.1 response regulator [Limnoraphis robusta CCNP1324]
MNSSHIKSKDIPYLLIVEDGDEDFEVFLRLMKSSNFAYPIQRCIDGDEVLDFLYFQGEYTNRENQADPAIIVMDLNLPGMDGRDVIAILKQDPRLKIIPIVVLTTSSNPKDIQACYQQGVNSYIQKPIGLDCLKKNIQDFISYWFETVILPKNIS